MNFEIFSRCKYRANNKPGDDVALVLPGTCFGVFDGATDAEGTVLNGIPAGRLAALTGAECTAKLLADPRKREIDAEELLSELSGMFEETLKPHGLKQLPATTVSLAIDCGDNWRFLCLGDSGIRINGSQILVHSKIIDHVATAARVALFEHFTASIPDLDDAEHATRDAIFLGLNRAIDQGKLDSSKAEDIVCGAASSVSLSEHKDVVRDFLMLGICKQYRFSNTTDTVLSYDVLSSGVPKLGQWVDELVPKSEVRSIEIFSDGYATPPEIASVNAWEAEFEKSNKVDFHRKNELATVKGGTTTEFFDDRTVIVAHAPN